MKESPLFAAIRLASGGVDYPLQIAGAADWRPAGSGKGVVARVALPAVPAGHLIAASLASPDADAPFRFRFEAPDAEATTGHFGMVAGPDAARGCEAVDVLVDCFATRRTLGAGALVVEIASPTPPRAYLLNVAIRPLGTVPDGTARDVAPIALPALSQTTLHESIRGGACSPTCVAMVVRSRVFGASHEAVAATAAHWPSRMLGVWPQNLWAAARHGIIGGIELLHKWEPICTALEAGSPVVASIRFEAGELAGAPLARTSGHLVVLRGIRGSRVLAHDPAAPAGSVERSYDAVEFANAWLKHRGAAYVFANGRLS